MPSPLVSFIMPLYKAERYVRETVQSVLSQTYGNFELVAVDDCGGDNTASIVKSFCDSRIRIIQNDRNMGIAFSRNRGIEQSRGEYIALLDDDDIALPDRLEKQVAFLQQNPDIGAIGGKSQWIDGDGNIIMDAIEVETEPRRIQMFLLFRNIMNNGEMTFRKSVVTGNDIKYHDGNFGMEDFDFWIQFLKFSKISNVTSIVLKRRITSGSETVRNKRNFSEQRARRFLELQERSLKQNGFAIDNNDRYVMGNYLSEYDRFCHSEAELNKLKAFIRHMCNQADQMSKDYAPDLHDWLGNVLSSNLETYADSFFEDPVFKAIRKNKRLYVLELEKGKNWLAEHCRDLEAWCKELEKGKNWLAEHCSKLEARCKELEKDKSQNKN